MKRINGTRFFWMHLTCVLFPISQNVWIIYCKRKFDKEKKYHQIRHPSKAYTQTHNSWSRALVFKFYFITNVIFCLICCIFRIIRFFHTNICWYVYHKKAKEKLFNSKGERGEKKTLTWSCFRENFVWKIEFKYFYLILFIA